MRFATASVGDLARIDTVSARSPAHPARQVNLDLRVCFVHWCNADPVEVAERAYPDLQPEDERSALQQRLDQYRALAAAALVDLRWSKASARLLPATDLTIAGVIRHLALAEVRWFQGRLLGSSMPPPWDVAGADDPDHAMRLTPSDTVSGIVALYVSAYERSRKVVAQCDSLDRVAVVRSCGRGSVNLRWISFT